MTSSLFRSSEFQCLTFRFDHDLASEVRAAGCPHCGGKLHVANYRRHPRGVAGTPVKETNLRLSFCCEREGCRRRVTPPSVRFLGRKVYVGAIVVLATAMRFGDTKQRVGRLNALFGIGHRTLQRWRLWWQECFPHTPLWKISKGLFATPIQETSLPTSLLDRFESPDEEGRVLAMLKFLASISIRYPEFIDGGVCPRRT